MFSYSTESKISNIEQMLKEMKNDRFRKKHNEQFQNNWNQANETVTSINSNNNFDLDIDAYLYSKQEVHNLANKAAENCPIKPKEKGILYDFLLNNVNEYYVSVASAIGERVGFSLDKKSPISKKIETLKKMINDNELILFRYDKIIEMCDSLCSFYDAANYKEEQIDIVLLKINFQKDAIRDSIKIKHRLFELKNLLSKYLPEEKGDEIREKSFVLSEKYFENKILGDGSLDVDAIKKNYRQLLKRFHPDLNNNDDLSNAATVMISTAYGKIMARIDENENI